LKSTPYPEGVAQNKKAHGIKATKRDNSVLKVRLKCDKGKKLGKKSRGTRLYKSATPCLFRGWGMGVLAALVRYGLLLLGLGRLDGSKEAAKQAEQSEAIAPL